jgi:hypothetical protein
MNMDNKQIEKGNKLILLFMGGIIGSSTEYPTGEIIVHSIHLGDKQINDFINETKYHKSWDWIMPAVEKIKDIDNEADIEMAKMLEFFKDDEECNIFHTSIFCHLKEVWNRTVVFIKWYNAKCQTVS